MTLDMITQSAKAMLTVDAHLDLSMNALEWNRDLTRPVAELRAREAQLVDRVGRDKVDRGKGTVAFPEMRRGGVALCVATQIARYVAPGNPLPGWHSPSQAWAQTQGQLAWYREMEARGELRSIVDAASLRAHLDAWTRDPDAAHPIGYVLSLEGADSMVTLDHVERAYANGLRAIGPAHYGPGVYAFGTDSDGGLGEKGRALLREMQRLNIILDATHLCDTSFWEAMDVFQGRVWASHSNCRALVPHNRQFSDDQLRELLRRGAVIGAAFDVWMVVPGWVRGTSTPAGMGATLARVVDHIDHICQIAGNADHVGLGTDLDGAFGTEQSPADIDTIADLQRVPDLLRQRGYSPADEERIMSGNWIRFLTEAWG